MNNAFDDGRRYVIVVSRSGIISPIRHIVELEEGVPYFQDEFSAWYYDRYNKIKDDEFVYCLSTKEMHEKRAQIEKEWEENDSVEAKNARWNEFKDAQTKRGECEE